MCETFYFLFAVVCVFVRIQNVSGGLSFIQEKNLNAEYQARTATGTIQGIKVIAPEDRDYFAYYGIPFAAPPLGQLRFRAPKPSRSWKGVLDATRERAECVQIQLRGTKVYLNGEEDCLYLNVYTPQNPSSSKKLLPVMVWFFGGAFLEGSANSSFYDPQYFMAEDIVLVAFNYRTNTFGFLSTQSTILPGNYGLKDQTMALRWIKRNIKNFGGNPNLVTIFGQSAGAASVHIQMQATQSKGLFHRVIAESGASTCEWAIQRNPKKFASQIFLSNGLLSGNDSVDLTKLRKISGESIGLGELIPIVQTFLFGFLSGSGNSLPTSPSFEPPGKTSIIPKGSLTLKNLENGEFSKVPLMMGITSNEAVFFQTALSTFQSFLVALDVYPELLAPAGLDLKDIQKRNEVGHRIKEYYFNNQPIVSSSTTTNFNFVNDAYWYKPIRKAAELHSKHIPVYFYEFTYEGDLGINGIQQKKRKIPGVGHTEEVFYLFKSVGVNTKKQEDLLMTKKMIRMWTNFAKYGNPTPRPDSLLDNVKWPLVDPRDIGNGKFNHIKINNKLIVANQRRENSIQFWEDLFRKYSTDIEHTSF